MSWNEENFIRGAARIIITDRREIESVSDILILSPGENQYDVRAGFYDFGVTKTGILIDKYVEDEVFLYIDDLGIGQFPAPGVWRMKVATQVVAELTWELYKLLQAVGDRLTVIFVKQHPDKTIRAWIFYDCIHIPMEQPINMMRGECSTIPVGWYFSNGTMLDQKPDETVENIIKFTDFNEWLATLDVST